MSNSDGLDDGCRDQFRDLVESVGVKRFSQALGISSRQVNRILSGAQPNPVGRLVRAMQAADVESGDRVLDFICSEMGGHFVRNIDPQDAAVNAVKECAEAIAAISDGELDESGRREVREAISALESVLHAARKRLDD